MALVGNPMEPRVALGEWDGARWTLRIGDEEICIAHGRVIKSVPGGRRAKALRTAYVEQRVPAPAGTPGTPK